MKRACFLLRVKPEFLEDYKRDHEAVDPELLEELSKAGIVNYSIFLRDDGLLVGYFESEDPRESWRRVDGTEANRIWQRKMKPYFQTGDTGEVLFEWLEQVFRLE